MLMKKKKLNLGTTLSYLDIFELEFRKFIVMFEISIFEFVKMQSFMLNKKKLNLRSTLLYFFIF